MPVFAAFLPLAASSGAAAGASTATVAGSSAAAGGAGSIASSGAGSDLISKFGIKYKPSKYGQSYANALLPQAQQFLASITPQNAIPGAQAGLQFTPTSSLSADASSNTKSLKGVLDEISNLTSGKTSKKSTSSNEIDQQQIKAPSKTKEKQSNIDASAAQLFSEQPFAKILALILNSGLKGR